MPARKKKLPAPIELLDPTPDVLGQAGFKREEYQDAMIAVAYLQYLTIYGDPKRAAQQVGKSAAHMKTPYWKSLLERAATFLTGDVAAVYRSANAIIAERFLQAMAQLMKDAINPRTEPRQRKEIMEFLTEWYALPHIGAQHDNTAARDYLQRQQPNNPLAPQILIQQANILIQEGSGGNVNDLIDDGKQLVIEVTNPRE